MGRRTITERIKRAGSIELKMEILYTWLDAWQEEFTELAGRLDFAVNIRDFDMACIAIGRLREVTHKKYTALYNVLKYMDMPDQAASGGAIYECGRFQTALIAIAGRENAANNWPKVAEVSAKLSESIADFDKIRDMINAATN